MLMIITNSIKYIFENILYIYYISAVLIVVIKIIVDTFFVLKHYIVLSKIYI